MSTVLFYLLKANACLVVFYIFYRFFLARETFFKFNRAYLMSAILLSFLIPSLEIPLENSFLSQVSNVWPLKWRSEVKSEIVHLKTIELSESQLANINPQDIKQMIVLPTTQQSTSGICTQQQKMDSDYLGVLKQSYSTLLIWAACAITGMLLLRLIYGLLQMFWLASKHRSKSKKSYTVIFVDKHLPTFSFFNYLFWQSNTQLSVSEKRQVLIHELAHIKQKHSFDVILAELLVALCWFNPVSYWYKTALKDLHEYQADQAVLATSNAGDYARLLLAQVFGTSRLSLANHFAQSQLLKRINMMGKNNSKRLNSWKYLLVIPLIILLGIQFGQYKDNKKSLKLTKMSLMTGNINTQGFVNMFQQEETPNVVTTETQSACIVPAQKLSSFEVESKEEDAELSDFMAACESETAEYEQKAAQLAEEYANKANAHIDRLASARACLPNSLNIIAHNSRMSSLPPSPVTSTHSSFVKNFEQVIKNRVEEAHCKVNRFTFEATTDNEEDIFEQITIVIDQAGQMQGQTKQLKVKQPFVVKQKKKGMVVEVLDKTNFKMIIDGVEIDLSQDLELTEPLRHLEELSKSVNIKAQQMEQDNQKLLHKMEQLNVIRQMIKKANSTPE
ncbi:MAG: M56 family metallopeptidase [Cytophagales bacterium]|nr:MAG: M56 family metallopeptidase [Cytophagales bacterium]TAF60317.1 MAG: M56 family metallopeptidase [Cytophagales bacterium]